MNPRLAVSTAFLVNGAIFASMACRLPDLQHHWRLDEAQLGSVLFGGASGAMLGVATAGRVCARFGSHRVTVVAGLLGSLCLAGLGSVPNLACLVVTFICFGATTATMDVAMNVNGVAVEKTRPKPIMSSLHGMFSLGSVTGAMCGWYLLREGVPVSLHFAGASTLFFVVLLLIAPGLLPAIPAKDKLTPVFALPQRAVLVVGLIGLCAFLAEGAMGDWSAIYLRKALHQPPATSALGYLAFTLSMMSTRFGGDVILHRWGPGPTLRLCGLVTAIGLGVALLSGSTLVTIVGFASVGFGMAIVAPVAFSLGGELGGENPDHAIASIATLSYTAFLVGPALIGFVAKAWSLRDALSIVVALALAISLLSGLATRRQRVTVTVSD